MKKFILGVIVGAILFVPAGAFAVKIVEGLPDANDIYQFNCVNYKYCNRVAVFDDQDNKCYVSYDYYSGRQSSISCVKK